MKLTTWQKTTLAVIVGTIVLLTAYDTAAAIFGGQSATISVMISWVSSNWWGAMPVLAFGVLIGHLFAQNRKTEFTDDGMLRFEPAALSTPRSPEWLTARARHLERQPKCQVCDGTRNLQVHHIRPFHLHPELELDPENLITLCENRGSNHHLLFGHLGDFRSFNPTVIEDARHWNFKLRNRPY